MNVGAMLFCRLFLQSFFILYIGFPPHVSSSALYRIQALHPNAQPVAPGDELAFLDGTEGPTFAGEDSFHPTRCPVDVVALASRSSTPADAGQQHAHARVALQLERRDLSLIIPMFPVVLSPGLTLSIPAGTSFMAPAAAARALHCSPSHLELSPTFRARVVLLHGHGSSVGLGLGFSSHDPWLAQSDHFLLRIVCAAGGDLQRQCPAVAAPLNACTLHHAAPWSRPFTSVGKPALLPP
jgi:hypothetical protein